MAIVDSAPTSSPTSVAKTSIVLDDDLFSTLTTDERRKINSALIGVRKHFHDNYISLDPIYDAELISMIKYKVATTIKESSVWSI